MNNPEIYCAILTNNCKLMAEWGVYWQAIGTIVALIVGIVGLYKIYHELRRLNEQREKDISDKEQSQKLKRTEFFLNQHRRLFDNPELFEILCLIDNDDPKLAQQDMADKKRKFLTFIEEIALLVKSNQINKDVALYMFGHYTLCVTHGNHFKKDIDFNPNNFGLLMKFAEDAAIYLQSNPSGPSENTSL